VNCENIAKLRQSVLPLTYFNYHVVSSGVEVARGLVCRLGDVVGGEWCTFDRWVRLNGGYVFAIYGVKKGVGELFTGQRNGTGQRTLSHFGISCPITWVVLKA